MIRCSFTFEGIDYTFSGRLLSICEAHPERAYVWRPHDLSSGEIERVLRGAA